MRKYKNQKVFFFNIFNYISTSYNAMFKDLLKEENLTQAEVDVLAFFGNNPEYNHAQDLVDLRGISKANASMAVDKLVKKGLLDRLPDPKNRRFNILLVDESAQPLLKKIQAIQKEYNEILYKDIEEEEVQLYLKTLLRMHKNLGGKG
ncbi:MAG: MarR family winged helix-turn-helix transcriptional regulator [Bacillota bacterium]|nr:MarR family winged helix-turn-helix transcriptional regulator [Bacillota bacterium]